MFGTVSPGAFVILEAAFYIFSRRLDPFRLSIRYRILAPPSSLAALYIVTRRLGPFRLPILYLIRAPPSC